MALSRCSSKEDAEDVCQEVLIALLNRKRPFKSNEHMKAWLIRAVIHRSKNVHRYEGRHPRTSYDPLLHDKATSDDANDHDKLHGAVESLPSELKDTLRLYYHDGYSTKEIASLKGIEESSVRARLHRARKKIAAALTCAALVAAAFFGSAAIPMQQIPEALAIDFATDRSASVSELPVRATQKSADGQAVVTFEASLTWNVSGAQRVTYNTNAENARVYSSGIGNYLSLNKGQLGSTKDAVQVTGGESNLTLSLEVSVPASDGLSNDELCGLARKTLEGTNLVATVYLEDGSSETAECTFTE